MPISYDPNTGELSVPGLPDGWGKVNFKSPYPKMKKDQGRALLYGNVSLPGVAGSFSVVYVKVPKDGVDQYVVMLKLGIDKRFDIPVVKDWVEASLQLDSLYAFYFSHRLDNDELDLDRFNNAIRDMLGSGDKPPELPSVRKGEVLEKGASFGLTYKLGERALPALVVEIPSKEGGQGSAGEKKGAFASFENIPLLRGVGLRYIPPIKESGTPGRVQAVLDAGWKMGPLDIACINAGMEMDTKGGVRPILNGLAISAKSPAGGKDVSVAGAVMFDSGLFWSSGGKDIRLDGTLLVSAPFGAVNLIGSYAKIADLTSFFVFGELAMKGGIGPEFFKIKRLMLGGGMNTQVRVPEFDEVSKFPFVAGLTDKSAVGEDPSPQMVLQTISTGDKPWVTRKERSYWVAGGLGFTSFEVIQGNALVLVQFGDDWSVALLGNINTQFPLDAGTPLVMLNMQFKAQLEQKGSELTFTAGGALAKKSYIIHEECQITGGIAMKAWLAGSQRDGDFVFTVGGFAPGYTLPDGYPKVPRVGYVFKKWGITMQAEAYFAIVPRGIMMGGSLSMSQDIGWLRWWCNLYADAWIEYQPFFAKVNAGASLGLRAEVKLAGIKVGLSFELGVDIGMWWVPEFGGTFTVHLWCLSYTGRWGVELPKDKPQQKWTDFQRQVPVPTTLTYGYNVEASELVKKPTTVESYKLKDDHLLAGGNGGFEDESAGKKQLLGPWLASANGFTFTVRSAMPCSAVYVNDEKQATGNTLDLRQVGITDRTAQFWITVDHVVKHDDRPEETKAVNIHRGRKWTFTPHKTNVPVAMYGKPGGETRPDKNIDTDKQQRLTNRLDGLQLQVPEPALRCAATVNDAPLRSSAADLGTEKVPYAKNVPYANYPLLPKDEPCGAQPSKVKDALTRIAQGLTHSGPRNDLFTALGRAGVQPTGANQALTRYPGAVSSLLIADPLIVTGDE